MAVLASLITAALVVAVAPTGVVALATCLFAAAAAATAATAAAAATVARISMYVLHALV
jgi:hypothetical protein